MDHAIYAVAVTSGKTRIKDAYFPFSRTAERFETNLKGRCKDVPQEIYPLLRSYEPYKGGSEVLWALNEVCSTNKHKLLIPIGTGTVTGGIDVEGTGYLTMPYEPVWDRAKNEMELFTIGAGSKFHGNFQFGFYIAFGQVDSLEGKNMIPVLDLFVDMVETIVSEIEAETYRLFPVRHQKP